MLTDLVGHAVRESLPPTPDTGALRTDLREMFGAMRDQLGDPMVTRIGPGLFAEAVHSSALENALRQGIAAPRRAAASRLLAAAVERGELPAELDMELGVDLLVAPLAFRMLIMRGQADDAYLDTVTNAVEAALRAAVPSKRA
jgi:hypothetical protein